ncbi:MAG: hypothetical protein ACE5G0_02540 [Rhodothermales bacterium]
MTWLKSMSLDETSLAQKAFVTLGACAVAGVAAVRLKRAFDHWREENLQFDFPIEEQLFIGWGGSHPRRIRQTS